MHLLGLLERPDSGHYALLGREVAGLSEDARALIRNREIGFVFQWPALLPRASALENVELPLIYAGLGGAKRRRKAKEALERVGLCEHMFHWPNQLSGGQQQRVAIARSLVNDPQLILGDEPTGNLDSRTSVEIMQTLRELNRAGKTIIMVTHEPDIANWAKRQIVMRDGVVFKETRTADIFGNPIEGASLPATAGAR